MPQWNDSTVHNSNLGDREKAIRDELNAVAGSVADSSVSFTDITTGNVSTSKHGFAPKAPNDLTKFLRGDASWAVPSAGSSTQGVFNVVTYGAVGDGTTDDSGAIQSAINAAVNATFAGLGGIVYFPFGKYYVATGLTCTLPGTSFVGQGQPGVSSDLSSGCTQVIVGDSQWGLTLGNTTGEYRGYHLENLQFFEKNAGKAYGGVKINTSSYGTSLNCSFGSFTNSVSTTFTGSNGAALSALSTLTLASTTGWPSSGSGFLQCVAGVGGQIYHSFWYTGVSGSTLTGVTYNAPTTDTVASGAAVTAAVGVGFLNNGGDGTGGESSNNRHIMCNFGTATFGYLQLGVSLGWFAECMFDGAHNIVTGAMTGTGLMIVSGSIQTSNCQAQGHDVLIHICKGNQNSTIDFRYEGFGSNAVVLESDAGTNSTTITGPAGNSQVTGHGPAIWIKPGVVGAVIAAIPEATIPVLDQGTGTRYARLGGLAQSGPSILGSVVGKQPVYDPTSGALIGYAPLYDSIAGVYLVRNLMTYLQAHGSTTSLSSVAHAISAPVAVGDLIVLVGGYGLAGSSSTITPSDTQGNTWQIDRHDDKTTSTAPHSFIASCSVTTALNIGDTITVTFGTPVNYPGFSAFDYAGVPNASWVDSAIGATGASTTPASGNLTTAASNELLVSSVYYAVPSPDTGVAGSGYTILDGPFNIAGTKDAIAQTKTSGTAGTYSAGATLGSSVDWAISLVAYKRS